MDDLAGIATGELIGVRQLNKESGGRDAGPNGSHQKDESQKIGTLSLSGTARLSQNHGALQNKEYLG
jgi:hypothetical protein